MTLFTAVLLAEAAVREVVYPGATLLGGQIVPRFDKGYLVYLDRNNLLEVHRPDGQLGFRIRVECPGAGSCSTLSSAVSTGGAVAVTMAFSKLNGWGAGIQIFSPEGKAARTIDTDRLVPQMLCFDRDDNLWVLGWQRDPVLSDREDTSDYSLVRKFDQSGKEIGRFLPRSLWPGKKSSPGAGSGGYCRMSAANDRIGAAIHENHADNQAEWVEWDLNGRLIRGVPMPSQCDMGRAYASDAVLYCRTQDGQLRRLQANSDKWTTAPVNMPDTERALLLGAAGNDLVFRLGPGNVRLIYLRPD